MNTFRTLALFAVGLGVVFVAAFGIGSAIGPDIEAPAPTHSGDDDHAAAADVHTLTYGLTSSANGYTLVLASSTTSTGSTAPVAFRIIGPDGAPVTAYTGEHEKLLHLIVVRRDLSGYQHLHPELDDSGTWSAPIDLTSGGDYRVYADFTPEGGEGTTLGTDLRVAGPYDPQPLPAPTSTTTVDGYTVTLDGTLHTGHESNLTLSVSRDGQPVTNLQSYLGTYGHLVALRADDLAYLHVHPDGHPGDGVTAAGPGLDFAITAPTAGYYRLYLDFQHDGVIRTAEFTVTASREGE
ncbi:MAG: hypothetical protein WAW17_15010 [Rhodococcus sp. (in: high G+C Gram-positive bacteria)]|uniref:hypothetical protein n=1 Tax=Rhodococcus sp. TaxID=1831 RepID=UPI003BB201A8